MSDSVPAALFDLDGTLVDSRPAILGAMRAAAGEFDGAAERLAEYSEGVLLAERLRVTAAAIAGHERAAEYAARYDEHYAELSPQLTTVYPDVVDVLAELRADGVRLGIVTNKGQSRTPGDLAPLDGARGGLDLFDVVVTADDTVERKPSPEPILHGLRKVGWRSESAVYVGDGPHDARAALDAGTSFIGAGWGYYGRDSLRTEGREFAVLDRPAELAPTLRRIFAAG
ncbi:HAD family hydrolase [Aeromicrobium sp. CF4.19]|uniref:HAD family hydrolase n=1 Tax=Aeromicrobium sp. CF4.19 TaxID=3373082 RepID=UPI003EE6CD2B